MPPARTRTRTCPVSTAGVGKASTRRSPGAWMTSASMCVPSIGSVLNVHSADGCEARPYRVSWGLQRAIDQTCLWPRRDRVFARVLRGFDLVDGNTEPRLVVGVDIVLAELGHA